MNPSQNMLPHFAMPDTWNEELARAKKYKEATQKRAREQQARTQMEQLKKRLQVGRVKVEA